MHIKNDWVVAVKPQPTFAPFFALDYQVRHLSGGSDGLCARECDTAGTLFPAYYPLPAQPGRRLCCRPATHARTSRLTAGPRARRAAQERLRDLAVAYDVSHETIRASGVEVEPPRPHQPPTTGDPRCTNLH